ncbi:hypothetical protein, conserved [Eimeria praecox]|uniref:Uncharacterized protein n=1 Tax=Eimeria praecox TaxID=51316 RepID=U6GYW9_9EIME|nr:hypothetical protein, conserved [Eimeria praecox]
MKIYTLGGPTLFSTFVISLGFPLRSLSVRVGLSLSPAAYDFNQSLSPADDSGWDVLENASIVEDPSSISQNSMAEMNAKGALKGEGFPASRAFKPVRFLLSTPGETQEIGGGSLSQLDDNSEQTEELDEYPISESLENDGKDNSDSFLQMDKLRRWWREQREKRARRREARRQKELQKERERRQAEGRSRSDSESSEEGSPWYGSGSESLLGEGSGDEGGEGGN